MNKVIVDTNIMVGIYDKKDRWHQQAKKLIKSIEEVSSELIYLDCVINETFTVIARRLKESKNEKVIAPTLRKVKDAFPKDKIINSYHLLETHYEEVIDRVIESKGKLNFHDALIITFALNKDTSFIASFDKDFEAIPGITLVFDPAKVH